MGRLMATHCTLCIFYSDRLQSLDLQWNEEDAENIPEPVRSKLLELIAMHILLLSLKTHTGNELILVMIEQYS